MTTARVVLHVGLPKTGTSFVQGTLRANREVLEQHGVHLPAADGEPLFGAVLHLTGRSGSWGRSDAQGERTWGDLVREVRRRDATTVVSSETLCLATPDQVARVVGDLEGCEVHVMVSLRDPVRQLPAEWQEGVKHGRRSAFEEFLGTVLADPPPARPGARRAHERFWRAQDPLGVLDRWSTAVPRDRVHVVTCPPPGAPRDALWRRVARVLDVEDAPVEVPEQQVNTSLGAAQTEVLRRVNKRVQRQGNERTYGAIVKRLYAGTILRDQGGARVVLPAEHLPRVTELAQGWTAGIEERGHPVAGDLADLVPRAAATPADAPDLAPRALLQVSLDATAELLREVERLREELARSRGGRRGGRAGDAS